MTDTPDQNGEEQHHENDTASTPRFEESEDRFEVKWKKKSEPRPANVEQDTAVVPPDGDVDALQRELEAERQRTTELRDRWQRAQADLANLRRRTEQERGEMEQFASMRLVQELLPVLDNFERALSTIPGNLQMLTWVHGILLIERHLQALLEHNGLTTLDVLGKPFSPYESEAIAERETDQETPGTILQVYQRGYSMNGRVIRPALVEVAAAPVEGGTEAVTEDALKSIREDAQTENSGP